MLRHSAFYILHFTFFRILYSAFVAIFIILHSAFFIPSALAQTESQDVVEVGPFCFRKDECKTYSASPPNPLFEAPECKNPSPGHNKKAVELEYKYNCYANQEEVNLQVSIGGYKVTGIEQYIRRLYVYFVSIAGIVAGIMIVWAGVKWLTSAGAPERITDAKKKIGNAVIGLVLILGSYVILQTINPALVSLKLPPVKIVRRDLGETQLWCVKRTEFPCGGVFLKQEGGSWIPDPTKPADPDGQWECSDPTYLTANNPPCGQPQGGKCYGQYCPHGETTGCQRLVIDRIASNNLRVAAEDKLRRIVRKCFDPADCNNCNVGPFTTDTPTAEEFAQGERGETLHLDKVALCISTACNCIAVGDDIDDGTPDPFRCVKRVRTGEHCNTDQECESSNCNLAWGNKCGPTPNGQSCDNDEDCESTLCNKNVAPNKCVGKDSIANGQDCSRSTECRSGICGYSNAITNWTPGIDPVCLSSGTQCEFNASRCNAD
ncbi:MAG: pilin [bacterium]|nr:pilin [bacterium]